MSPNIREAHKRLSERYRNNRAGLPLAKLGKDEHQAYLVARMPATYAVVQKVLSELAAWLPQFSPTSLLDLGAGPGTASLAAFELFDSLTGATLVEQDGTFINLARQQLAKYSTAPIEFVNADINSYNLKPHELLIASYVLNELDAQKQLTLISKSYASANTIVLIEPGTPHGFANILAARKMLISLGAHIVAPCSHGNACPMQGKDWCHFSVRVDRSQAHRLAKDASLPYEDEKFSYLIASKSQPRAYDARIVKAPQVRSGHIHLDLCEADGLKRVTLSKKHGDDYRSAKKLEWGSTFSQ